MFFSFRYIPIIFYEICDVTDFEFIIHTAPPITERSCFPHAIKRNKCDDRAYDGLRVATMHRVKGLEFMYVFIAAVNNRIVPLPSAINKTDAVSEAETMASEKCLLYVAMTRAQKGAYITSYGKCSEFIRNNSRIEK